MKKFLLLHGWGGSDYPHWQSWLAGEIAKEYGTLSFPKLGDPDFPDKDEWMRELKEHLNDFRPDIVICHSLANILWFHLCNEDANILKNAKIEKLYLVAPPSLMCQIEELKSFFPANAPKDLYAKEVMLITSTTDEYMTPQEAQELQELLGVEMKVIKEGGHLNASSGYGEWPWILQELNI